MKVVFKVPVLEHLFYPVRFCFVAPRGLYIYTVYFITAIFSSVTRSTLSLFALGVTWPLCFLRVKDIRYSTLKICLFYNIISSSLSKLSYLHRLFYNSFFFFFYTFCQCLSPSNISILYRL